MSSGYWYFIWTDACPVCGRERRPGPRPEHWNDRHEYTEQYDWCEN